MKMNKIIAALLSIFLFIPLITPAIVMAEDNPTVMVKSVSGSVGSTVNVFVTIENNPGILGATFSLEYDNELTLENASNGDAFSMLTMTKPGKFISPCRFTWDAQDIDATEIKDGNILNLQFKINESASNGNKYNIKLSYYDGDIVDANLNPVSVTTVNGTVTVIDYMPGDLNGDGKVNSSDIILLRRHIAGGYEQSINESAADVNNDKRRNSTDVILMRRYIAGGYDVELKPSTQAKPQCVHSIEEISEIAPTCTEDGNIAYWHCTICDCYYSDANASTEIKLSDTVVKATGHTIVIDEAVSPTYDHPGYTEGKHCSACGEIIVAPKEIPVLQRDEYSITYYIANNDNYLKSLAIDNLNPTKYSTQEGLILQDLIVDGYNFKGWYTSQTGGEKLTSIPAGERGNRTLYAQWEKVEYTISFASDMVPVDNIQYTVSDEIVLTKPSLDKYTFVGWSDKDGKMWNTIPAGTTGDINLYANWASNRNRAVAKKQLDEPMVFEDTDNGIILFTYELGEIQNVPLYQTLNLQCANGLITTNSVSKQTQITREDAEKVAKTISKATTNSSAWTLSSDWNNTTHVNEAYSEKIGETKEESETNAKSQNNTYNCSSTSGGSSSRVNTNEGSFRYSQNNAHMDYSQVDTQKEYELTTDDKLSTEVSAEVKAGYGPVSASVGAKVATESSVNEHYGEAIQTSDIGTNSWNEGLDESNSYSNTTTDSKNWNTSSGYSSSNQTSTTNSISNILSKEIATQKQYGKSYSAGGSNSESQEFASSNSNSDEYCSIVTYHTSEIETKTREFQSTGNTIGNYRMVQAGTMHVFGVVGYDIAKKTYFVYTYNVLDDKIEEYLDYSRDGSFTDYETSIIPFEIPYYVNNYVNNKIIKTEGLVFDPDTGMIVDYIPTGEQADNIVIIPSYMSVDNNDGTFKSVKVTGIADGLFKDNTNITAVQLGKFINKIPDSTFEGCTNLKYILSPGVTKIGNNAFAGCRSLSKYAVPVEITEVGTNAFNGVPEITVIASNADIAKKAAASGAEKITLDIFSIPDSETKNLSLEVGPITSFELQGKDRSYSGLSLKSDAETTIINGVTFTDCTGIPMELSSRNVTLDRVNATAGGFALLLSAENTNVKLNRTISLTSTGENAVLCKNLKLSPLSSSVIGKMNVSGNVLVAGSEIEGKNYLTVSKGEIKYITDDYFNNILTSYMVSFNANGGSCSIANKTVTYNDTYGTLPTATKTGYTFNGWYTEASGGTKISEDTQCVAVGDQTLYAQWTPNTYSVAYNANGGSGSMSKSSHTYDTAKALTANGFTRTGYTFAGWATSTSGSVAHANKANVKNLTATSNGTVNLYAQWTPIAYSVAYNANGGSGSMSKSSHTYDTAKALTANGFTRTGYTFAGWATSTSGSVAYANKASVKNLTATSGGTVNLYAQWTVNSYTYNVKYKSSNGTDLGSTTVKKNYGTTNTITAPAKTGYTTPSSQSVKWDSTSAKTITFTYTPKSVSTSQTMGSGTWWTSASGLSNITYSIKAEYRNRTANSVQMRCSCTNTLTAQGYYGYAQAFYASFNGVGTGDVAICSNSTWASASSSNRSSTGTSGWVTISGLSPSTTSITFGIDWWDANGKKGSVWKDFSIPTY